MTDLLQKLGEAAGRSSPGAYGRWGAWFSGSLALVGTGLSALVGGWDGPIKALLFFMAFDFLSGFAAACRERRADSQVMLWGGVGKVMLLLLVWELLCQGRCWIAFWAFRSPTAAWR